MLCSSELPSLLLTLLVHCLSACVRLFADILPHPSWWAWSLHRGKCYAFSAWGPFKRAHHEECCADEPHPKDQGGLYAWLVKITSPRNLRVIYVVNRNLVYIGTPMALNSLQIGITRIPLRYTPTCASIALFFFQANSVQVKSLLRIEKLKSKCIIYLHLHLNLIINTLWFRDHGYV